MGRKKLENPPVKRLVLFDPEVWEGLEFLYYDKFSQQMQRNAVNDLVNSLLRENLSKVTTAIRESKNDSK